MSDRKSTSPSIQLFPFLAVLVCIMGALIFLLLVTTHRIRQKALARAAALHVVELREEPRAADAGPARLLPDLEAGPPPAAPAFLSPPAAPPVLLTPPETITTPPEPVPLPPAGPTAEELRREWEQTLQRLEAERAQLQSQLRDAGGASQGAAAQRDSATRELQKLHDLRRAVRQAVEQSVQAARQSEQERTRLAGEMQRVSAELARVRAQHAEAPRRSEFLAYDGQSGTTRRPILIECTESGLTFASEQITLTAGQLNGFTPNHNPLRAGAEALTTYWAAKDLRTVHAGERIGRPYVLLIVRPEGTTAYYVARRLLESLEQPFGYELVTAGQQIAWPETDPEAVQACRQAIDAVLAQRERQLAQTQTGRFPVASQLQFVDEQGRFHLEEVERLRRGNKTVTVGGRQFDRSPAAGSRSAPAGSPSAARVVEIPPDAAGEAGHGGSGRPPLRLKPPPGARAAANPPADVFEAYLAERRQNQASQTAPPASGTDAPAGSAEPREDAAAGAAADSARGGVHSPPVSGARPRLGAPAGGPGNRRSGPINPENPQWGVREPGSNIGLEREVIIRVNAAAVHVAGESPIQIAAGMSREDLQLALAETLDAHVRSWGRPPKNFYWLPSVRYQVLPGGNQYQERLAELTGQWALRSTVEQVLE